MCLNVFNLSVFRYGLRLQHKDVCLVRALNVFIFLFGLALLETESPPVSISCKQHAIIYSTASKYRQAPHSGADPCQLTGTALLCCAEHIFLKMYSHQCIDRSIEQSISNIVQADVVQAEA